MSDTSFVIDGLSAEVALVLVGRLFERMVLESLLAQIGHVLFFSLPPFMFGRRNGGSGFSDVTGSCVFHCVPCVFGVP